MVLITNDVDEAILLADRIIPLTAGPRARRSGPAVPSTSTAPRDRKALNHDPRFKEIRAPVIDYLLGPGRRRPVASSVEPLSMARGRRSEASA